jgi:hypothetical protein
MPTKWPALLQVLSDTFGARAGMLLARTDDRLHGLDSGLMADLRAQFVGEGWDKDTTRFDWLVADCHPGFRTDLDFASQAEMAAIPPLRRVSDPESLRCRCGDPRARRGRRSAAALA